MRPLRDGVIVERTYEPYRGRIILPDSHKREASSEALVMHAGPTAKVRVGQRILFPQFAGDTIEAGGRVLVILEGKDVLAVVDDAPWGAS